MNKSLMSKSISKKMRFAAAFVLTASCALLTIAASGATDRKGSTKGKTSAAPKEPTVIAAPVPASGTLTPGNQTITYTDGPLVINPTHLTEGSPICTVPNSCSDFTLTVSASSMAATHNVVWTMQWPVPNVDCDMFILQNGNLVAANIGYSDPSVLALSVPADGTVYHLVTSCTTGTSLLTGTAKLEQKYPTSGQGAGVPPRYINYSSGAGQATNSGEPSIGVDWNPNVASLKNTTPPTKLNTGGVAFFTAVNDQWRSNFDDCSSPAVNLWQDMNSPIVTGLDPIGFVDHFSTVQLGTSYPPPSTPGRIFHLQLLTAAGSHGAFSDNDGGSWISVVSGGPPAGIDHETLGGGPFHAPLITPPPPAYPNATYYCSQYGVENAACSRSDDGGVNFGPAVPIFPPQLCAGGLHGHIKVSPQGTAYVPNSACAEGPTLGAVGVALSKDNGITWTHQSVPSSTGSSDPAVGIGQNNVGKPPGQVANTIYLGWISADGHAHAAHSPDEGETWEDDIDISSIFGIEKAVFPAMVAGDDNRATFAFLGTHPAFYPTTNVWHLYIATTYDGGNSWILIDATPNDPVQIGNICLLGTGCSGARNLLDFNGIDVDAEGRVLVAYADGCVNCSNNQTAQSNAAKGVIARQSGGRRLFSMFDPVEPAPPAAPRLVSAIRKTVPVPGVEVGWLEPDNSGSPITGYNIYRSTTSGTETFLASVSGAQTTKFFDTTATTGSNWFYRVTALNDFNGDTVPDEGPFCREVNVDGAQPSESACLAPFLTKGGAGVFGSAPDLPADPTNGQLTLQRIAIGEPFTACVDQSITFLIKVQNLNPTPVANGIWRFFFHVKDTTNTDREVFVSMDTTNGIPAFNYGYRDGPTTTQCGLPVISSCPVSGTSTPDGTILIKLDVSPPLDFFSSTNTTGIPDFVVNIPVGTDFTQISGQTYTFVGTPVAGGQLTVQRNGGTGTYTTMGNSACISAPPVAILTGMPLSGDAPLTVNFDASASNTANPCAPIVSYTMDFGDGTPPVTQASPLFSHTYYTNGFFPATLTVKDSANIVSTNPAQLIIEVTLPITHIKSRKVHGAAGTFDLDLPLEGVAAVECRTGGTNNDHTIIFTFDRNLTGVGSATVTQGTATINVNSGIGPAANQYTLNLTGVTNAQHLVVKLDNVQDTAGVNLVNVFARMDVLFGDVNAVSGVTGSDVNLSKGQVGVALSSSNFLMDVNVTGFVSGADVNLIKAAVGTLLP